MRFSADSAIAMLSPEGLSPEMAKYFFSFLRQQMIAVNMIAGGRRFCTQICHVSRQCRLQIAVIVAVSSHNTEWYEFLLFN
jgi:hypothetical protein